MDEIETRLKESADACVKAYQNWSSQKKNFEAREKLQEATHELRKVAARLEIEIAVSERDEMTQRPIPIPPHRHPTAVLAATICRALSAATTMTMPVIRMNRPAMAIAHSSSRANNARVVQAPVSSVAPCAPVRNRAATAAKNNKSEMIAQLPKLREFFYRFSFQE